MNTDELFIDAYNLPQPLTEEELSNLIKQSTSGSTEARNKLIEHNLRLVLYEVTTKFKNINYDKKDLVSIGTLGLVKAIDTYDISKGYKFSSYAIKFIDNEILMFFRKLKRIGNVDSLDRVVLQDKNGNGATLQDQLSDNKDFVEDSVNAETYRIIRELVDKLADRDREIIMLYFGFYNNQTYTEQEIADKMNITKQYVSKLIKKNIQKISNILEFKGLIELRHSNSLEKGINSEEMTTKTLSLKK